MLLQRVSFELFQETGQPLAPLVIVVFKHMIMIYVINNFLMLYMEISMCNWNFTLHTTKCKAPRNYKLKYKYWDNITLWNINNGLKWTQYMSKIYSLIKCCNNIYCKFWPFFFNQNILNCFIYNFLYWSLFYKV